MNLIKIFLSATLLIMAFTMSGCQGNNSDTPENNVTEPIPLPPVDNNSTLPASLSFVNGSEVNATSSGQTIDIVMIVKNDFNTTDVKGDISVQYLTSGNTGLVTNSPATISNGIVSFSYTAPNDLKGAVDSGTTFSDLRFFSIDNPSANVTLRVNYTPGSSIVVGEPVLKTLTLSESNITITQSEETKNLTLFAYTDQSTTDINLSVGIIYGNTEDDVGYFTPASPSIVNGRVSLTYNGPLNLLTTAGSLSSSTFTLFDNNNPGITVPLTVNFLPDTPKLKVESPTITLTEDAVSETVTILAFDSNNQAFNSGTILVQYPSDITNGTYSGGIFTQNEATISNGKAIFSFVGPTPLTTIPNQTFTFKYKENQSSEALLVVQYTPNTPQITGLSIDESNTTISNDQEIHTAVINAIDASGNFVNSGTIKVSFPSVISDGTDVGSFTSFNVNIVNGQASFNYTGPKHLLDTSLVTPAEVFTFIDTQNNNNEVNWTINFIPDTPTIRMDESNITIISDSQVVSVKVLAFDKNNQSLNSGTISVTYPSEIVNGNVNGGLFTQTEVAISAGEAVFTYTGPTNLTADTSSLDFIFTYKENTNVSPTTLTLNYAPLSASIYLNETTQEVTLNSETFNMEVDVRDSNNNPFTTGTVKVVYPDDVKLGRDVGSFISSEITLDASGKASFVYTAPKNLDANTSDITFGFYHDSEPSLVKNFVVTLNPVENQNILTDYTLTSSYAGGSISMDLESTKLITFYVNSLDENNNTSLLGDSNITSLVVTVLNTQLADLDDTNASTNPENSKTLYKNSASLSIISNTVSGIVPIKVVATFKDLNNNETVITEVFNVVIVSGPPTGLSISYASTANDGSTKFVEKMIVAIVDKYSNRVNNNPGYAVGLISGYATDTSGSLNYMYHNTGGTIDANDLKFKVNKGSVARVNMINDGEEYLEAPTVALSTGGTNFAGTAHLATYGSISSIAIGYGGKEYTVSPSVSISGTGSGFSGTTVLKSTGTFFTNKTSTSTGASIIVLDNPGAGYTSAPTISAIGGTNFDAVAVLEATGSIKSLSIDDAGSGYSAGDILPVDGDGNGGSVKVKEVDGAGAITKLSLLNAGSGYTAASVDTLTKGNADATITSLIGFSVKEIQLKNGGTGYSNDTITISGGSPDITAEASATIGYGVDSVTILEKGSGYKYPTVVISGDGSDAIASASVKYGVSYVSIENAGSGYSDGDSIDFTSQAGDSGIGASATISTIAGFSTVVENTGTSNDQFLMTFGNGYTYDASGKWDINKTGVVDDFELYVEDEFNGTTTSDLGFAIGNNIRQDTCIDGKEWVAEANTPNGFEFDSNGLAEIEISYDYYLTAKDIMLSVNLVGAQNSLGESVKIGESVKHTLRGNGLLSEIASLPAGLDHKIVRFLITLDGTSEPLRNANFTYRVATTSLGIIIHSARSSMDDGIQDCGGEDGEGRAYVDVVVSTTLASTLSLENLVISREFN